MKGFFEPKTGLNPYLSIPILKMSKNAFNGLKGAVILFIKKDLFLVKLLKIRISSFESWLKKIHKNIPSKF